FPHIKRMSELMTSVNHLVTQVHEAQTNLRSAGGPDSNTSTAVNAVAARLITEPVRYGKPGLQAQITYLAGMTANIDQKIGRDAIERYEAMKNELDLIRADVVRQLGPAPSTVVERP